MPSFRSFTVALFLACYGLVSAPSATARITAIVSITPQAWFVERIGGEHVAVSVLVGPGQSHHTYEPTPKQIAELAGADVYFRIGAPFENGLATKIAFTMDRLRVVETQKGNPLNLFPLSAGEGKPDPHVWMAPRLAIVQAQNIADALALLDPPHADSFKSNLAGLAAELEQLDRDLAASLGPFKGRKVYVFHPAYGYFLESYGLIQASIEVEGKEPGPRHLAEMISKMKAEKARVIFVQPQFSKKTAAIVASAIGARMVEMDPLARDYIRNLREAAEKIIQSFASENIADDRSEP